MSSPRPWSLGALEEGSAEALAEGLPASSLWSVLLEVMNRRAGSRSPAEVLRQWERDPFSRPAPVDQRTLLDLESRLLAAAEGFEALELSPVAPLGTCSTVGLASQNKVLSALRGTEVVSDPTNVMALECARRLRGNRRQVVRLATCHRCVRAQAVPRQSGFTQHFRMFCLATGGRERGSHGLLVEALQEHIGIFLRAMDRLEERGYHFPGCRMTLLTRPELDHLGDRVAEAFPHLPVDRELLEHPYYDGIRFMLWVRASSGEEIPLADGGAFDWLAKLANDRKMVFAGSGLGSQLTALLFRR